MLTKGQKYALKMMESGRNVFLSGEAGTGKSYVLNQFIERNSDKNIVVCAPTGIAAINVHGSTLHRTFKIPIEPISPAKRPKKRLDIIEKADIIVIDEISMCRFDVFDYVTKSIRMAEYYGNTHIQLIVVGDFFQLPPVITEKDRDVLENYWSGMITVGDDDIGDGFAFQCPGWKDFDFVTVCLTDVMRQKGDVDFVTNLNKIRVGDSSAVEWFNTHAAPKQNGIYLCATNKMSDQINKKEAAKIKKEAVTYRARSIGNVLETDKPTTDILDLKVGLQVMALINEPNGHYQNGSIGIIKSLRDDYVTVEFDENIVDIARYTWEIVEYEIDKNDNNKLIKNVVGSFEQLPLKIAYAITIHKSQGQTYERVNIDPACFAPGQLYVALSRAKTIDGLHLTAKIKEEFLITSQKVIDFYKSNTKKKDNEIENVTKSTHGGSRSGSGRKRKYGVETCTIRIPKSAKEDVMKFIASRSWE